MEDKEIKDSLEGLDTLSGGIVYAKEEAWDKIQARLDKKPARKIAVYVRAAAAVVLLLLGYAGYVLLMTDTAQHVPNPTVSIPFTDTEGTLVTMPQIATETMRDETKVITTHTKRNQKETNIKQYTIEPEPMPQVPDPMTNGGPEPVLAVSEPPAKLVKKMRVVHINDLNAGSEEPELLVAWSGPSLDISKLRVVSLNELDHQTQLRLRDEEIVTLIRINRPHTGFLGFANSFSSYGGYNTTLAQSPFSVRLNRKN